MTYGTSKAFCILVIYVVWNWISRIHSSDLFSGGSKCCIDWFGYTVDSDYCLFAQSEYLSYINCWMSAWRWKYLYFWVILWKFYRNPTSSKNRHVNKFCYRGLQFIISQTDTIRQVRMQNCMYTIRRSLLKCRFWK